MTRVTCKDLFKRFGETIAVANLSVEIESGELFFLIGPSGCGKTSLLRLIAGFEHPDHGAILFDGQEMQGVPVEKRNLGIVFQHYALWPHMTVGQNISFGLELRRTPIREIDRKVADALARVRLPGFESRFPHQLSGGQQQRVSLARALALEPRLILFDEPLSNLDPSLRTEIRHEIRELHAALKLTMIYVTHDQEEALSMADRVAVMKGGVLVQVAAPQPLYHTPKDPFVATFLGDTNLLHGVSRGDAQSPLLATQGLELRYIPRSPVEAGEELVCLIRPEHLSLSPTSAEEATVRGTIKSVTFLGATTKFEVAVAPEVTLKVSERSTGTTPPQNGDQVTVYYNPKHLSDLR